MKNMNEGDIGSEVESRFAVSLTEKKEEFPLSGLALVRLLSAPPRIDHGRIILETAFQSSEGRPLRRLQDGTLPEDSIPRITLHFSLNDCVKDTSTGENSWKGADLVVVSGLEETMNDNPEARLMNLLGADTYFEVDPNIPMKLPEEAMLIMPAKNNNHNKGVPKPAHIETYKSFGFTTEEVQAMYKERATTSDPSQENLILSGKQNCFESYMTQGRVLDLVYQFADTSPTTINIYPPYEGVVGENGGFTHRFIEFATKKGVELEKGFQEYAEFLCRDKSKRDTVHRVLLSKGYQILPSSDDGWHNREADKQLKITAKKMGVSSERHTGSIHMQLEDMILKAWKDPSMKDRINSFLQDNRDNLTPYLKMMLKKLGYANHEVSK